MKNIYDDVTKLENEAESQNVFSAQDANAQPQQTQPMQNGQVPYAQQPQYAPPMQDGQVQYAQQPQYAPPMQDGQVPYAQPPQYAPPMQDGQVPYAQPQYAPPMQDGQVPYAQPQYVPPMQDGQAPYAQQPMYAQNPYGQPVYPMYPQPPYGQPMYAQPMYNPYAQPMYAPPMPPQQNTGAMYGLSQEQMDELVSQYLVSKKDDQQESGDTTKSNGENVQTNPNLTNSRVIFQSDDFDKIEDASNEDRDNGEFRVDDEPLGFAEQNNEEIQLEPQVKELESFNPEFVEGDMNSSGLPTSVSSKGFSVFEVEVGQEELNGISRKHPVKVKTVDLPQSKQEETIVPPIYTKPKLPDGFVVEEFEEVLDPISEFKSKDFTKSSDENVDTAEKNFDVEQEEVFFNLDEMQEDKKEEKESKSKKTKKSKKEKKEKTEKAPKKKKKISKFEIVRKMVLSLAVIGIIGSCGMLGYEYWLSSQNKALESEVNDLLIDVDSLASEEESDKNDKDKDNKGDKDEEKVMTVEEQWAEIKKEFPDVVFPVDTKLEYAKLYATNQDFAGYLSAKGVKLSLPVVQTENDDDYYRTNFYGANTKYGCPFVTHLNSLNPLDQNTVIFGHHMNDGTVFGALDAYKSIDGFKAAPVVTFDTLTTDYEWKVVAAFITNAYAKEDDGYIFKYYFTQLSTEERFSAYLSELSKRSLYDTGVDVLPTDKLLTLSTCSHEFDEARFVVVARLVRPGESADVDTSLASVNPSPRYPQAYYDAKGLTNPYKNTYNWEVG